MLQQVIIALLFLGAAFYLGRLLYRSFQAKHACESGCGKCNAADIDRIAKKIEKAGNLS